MISSSKTDSNPDNQSVRNRRWREKIKTEPERRADYEAGEKARKAAWYQANKEKKNATQKRYRQEKREQSLMNLVENYE